MKFKALRMQPSLPPETTPISMLQPFPIGSVACCRPTQENTASRALFRHGQPMPRCFRRVSAACPPAAKLRAEMSHAVLVSSALSGYFALTPTTLFGTRHFQPTQRSFGGDPSRPAQTHSDSVCVTNDQSEGSHCSGDALSTELHAVMVRRHQTRRCNRSGRRPA
jgi:hypothetical protein